MLLNLLYISLSIIKLTTDHNYTNTKKIIKGRKNGAIRQKFRKQKFRAKKLFKSSVFSAKTKPKKILRNEKATITNQKTIFVQKLSR